MGGRLRRARIWLVVVALGAFMLVWGLASCSQDASRRPTDGRPNFDGVSEGLAFQDGDTAWDYRDATMLNGRLTVPSVCDEGSLVSTAENGMGARARWEVLGSPPDVSARILLDYQEAEAYALAFDGYLDLFGAVWGCVVTSEEGWAEVVLVDGRGNVDDAHEGTRGAGACVVTVVRLGQGQAR